MKFFLMTDPALRGQYASFSHVGTWSAGCLCKKCGQPSSKLIAPLLVEWEAGADAIGDFSWCGYTTVIRSGVSDLFSEKGFDCKLEKVTVVPPTGTGKKIVSCPYSMPELKWLVPRQQLPINEIKSAVDLLIDCDKCKQRKYTFKTEGLYVDSTNWSGQKIFSIKQYSRSDALLITEDAVCMIKDKAFSNVTFIEAGIID